MLKEQKQHNNLISRCLQITKLQIVKKTVNALTYTLLASIATVLITIILLSFALITFGPFHVESIATNITSYVSTKFLPSGMVITSQNAEVKWYNGAVMLCTTGNKLGDTVGHVTKLPDITLSLRISNLLNFSDMFGVVSVDIGDYALNLTQPFGMLDSLSYKRNNQDRLRIVSIQNIVLLKEYLIRVLKIFSNIRLYNITLLIPNDRNNTSNNTSNVHIRDLSNNTAGNVEGVTSIHVDQMVLSKKPHNGGISGTVELSMNTSVQKFLLDFSLDTNTSTRKLRNLIHFSSRKKVGYDKKISSTPLFQLNVKNLSLELLELLAMRSSIPITGLLSGNLKMYIGDDLGMATALFTVSSDMIRLGSTKQHEHNAITVNNMEVNGVYKVKDNVITAQYSGNIATKMHRISGDAMYNLRTQMLEVGVATNHITLEELYDYWPDNLLSNTKIWLKHSLHDGVIQNAHVKFDLDFNCFLQSSGIEARCKNGNSTFIMNKSIIGEVLLDDSKLTYMYPETNQHSVMIKQAKIKFDKSKLVVDVENAQTTEGLILSNYTATIQNMSTPDSNPLLTIQGKISGDLRHGIGSAIGHLYPVRNQSGDTVDGSGSAQNNAAQNFSGNKAVISKSAEKHNLYDNKLISLNKLRQAKGRVDCTMLLSLPLKTDRNMTYVYSKNKQNPISNFVLDGVVSDFAVSEILGKYNVMSKQLKMHVQNNGAEISGVVSLNNAINTAVSIQHTYDQHLTSQLCNTQIYAKFLDIPIEQIENFTNVVVTNKVNGVVSGDVMVRLCQNDIAFSSTLNLKKTKLFLPVLSILKPVGVNGYLTVNSSIHRTSLQDQGYTTQSVNYIFNVPGLFSKGVADYDLIKREVTKVTSPITKLRNDEFALRYVKEYVAPPAFQHDIVLSGKSLDLSWVLLSDLYDTESPIDYGSKLRLRLNFDQWMLKNKQLISQPKFDILCSNGVCKSINIQGLLGDKKKYTVVHQKIPVLAVVSGDTGNLLKSLDIYRGMNGGELDLRATVNDDFSLSGGQLCIRHFSIKNAPILAELFKIASLTSAQFFSIFEMFKVGQISFNTLYCDLLSKNGVIFFENCSMDGSTVGITGHGSYDTRTQYISIKGYIIPSSIIGNMMNLIQSGLRAGNKKIKTNKDNKQPPFNFMIEGNIDGKMTIHSNPLSVIAPGPFGKALATKS